jgi:glucose-6-phosphate 1-dehydrogenase
LDVLKRWAILIDQEATGKIGRFEYYDKMNALKDEIDNAVIVNCKIQQGG